MIRYWASTALLLISIPVFAQASDAGPTRGRVLNGHLFLASQVVEDPFITTYLGTSTGFGYATISANQVDNLGNVVGKTQFQLGALGQGFNLQVGILDSWAIRLAASGTVLSGIDAQSALTIGATIGYSLSTGATYTFLLGGMRMAGALDLEYAPQYIVSPVTALLNTLNNHTIDTSTLFTTQDTIRLRPAFLAAMGLTPSLGLRAVIDYAQEFVSGTQTSNSGALDLGAALDFDFHALAPVPLGLLAGYKVSVPTSGDGLGHQFTFGLFYTGRSDLGLGLETVMQLPAAPTGTSNFFVFLVGINLRYYWD
jgi:hypothetical protein